MHASCFDTRMWRKENHKTSKVHFFSSHFFSTLQEKGPSGVSRWTTKKNIDIFSKTFIFIPINESLHWSLCVVCNPGEFRNAAKYYDGDQSQKKALAESLMPCILFMDSLKAHRKMRVASVVRKWLNFKWEETKEEMYGTFGREKMFDRETLPIFDPLGMNSNKINIVSLAYLFHTNLSLVLFFCSAISK